VTYRNLKTETNHEESYDRLILSPGGGPFRPPIPGIDLPGIFTLRNIPDAENIKEYIDTRSPKSALVVGGSFIGLEMVENLAKRGIKIMVVELLDQLMAPLDPEMAEMIRLHLVEKGVTCLLKTEVESFTQKDGKLHVKLSPEGETTVDMVMMTAGIRPENRLAKEAGLAMGERGGVLVDGCMRSSDPNIYVVGDAVQVRDFSTGFPSFMATSPAPG